MISAQPELWELYKTEATPEGKKDIIQALFVGGGGDRIAELARTETDPALRRTAVRTLGLLGSERTGPMLVSLYQSDHDPEVKREAHYVTPHAGGARLVLFTGGRTRLQSAGDVEIVDLERLYTGS